MSIATGRLGNNLWQVVGLVNEPRFIGYKKLFIGYSEVLNTIDVGGIDDCYWLEVGARDSFVLNCLRSSMFFLANKTRLLGFINYDLSVRKGGVGNVLVSAPISYLPASWANGRTIFLPPLRKEMISRVESWLASRGLIKENFALIHVRLGDALHWPSPERPMALSGEFYEEAIRDLKVNNNITKFVVITDDEEAARQLLGEPGERFLYTNNSFIFDFTMFALAPNLIVSDGTFSFWGVMYSRACRGLQYNGNAPSYFLRPPVNPKCYSLDWFVGGVQTQLSRVA